MKKPVEDVSKKLDSGLFTLQLPCHSERSEESQRPYKGRKCPFMHP